MHPVQALRKQQNLSALGLAVKAGISTNTLQAIERHGFRPRLATQQKVARALGASVERAFPSEEEAGTVKPPRPTRQTGQGAGRAKPTRTLKAS